MSFSKKRKLEEADNSDAPSSKKSKQSHSNSRNKNNSNNNSNSTSNSSGSNAKDPWQSPEAALSWLLHSPSDSSLNLSKFFSDFFGQKPLFISRNDLNYYSDQYLNLTLSKITEIANKNELFHGRDIVSKYCVNDSEQCPAWLESKKEANQEVAPGELNNILSAGCTFQYHHPQHKYFELTQLLQLLESYFKVCVGSNVYVTPNETQGLAPHWDDVDVWVLQMEGRKHWKLYSNGFENGSQPFVSSGDLNLNQGDAPGSKLIMECDLAPGDLLYLPRGTIHCAQALKNDDCKYSNHLTISSHQGTGVAHFEKLLLEKAMDHLLDESNISGRFAAHRRNVDSRALSKLGSSFGGSDKSICNQMIETLIKSGDLESLMQTCTQDAADVVQIEFLQDRLPPIEKLFLTNDMIYGNPKNQELAEKAKKSKESEEEEVDSKPELDMLKITKSTKIKFKNRDYVRFVDSDKHPNLMPQPDRAPAAMFAGLMDTMQAYDLGDQKDGLEVFASGANAANAANGVNESLESPAIPSRKKREETPQMSARSEKSVVTRIVSIEDTPGDKGSKRESEELEDFDVDPTGAAAVIVDRGDTTGATDALDEMEFGGLDGMDGMDAMEGDMEERLLLLYHCLHNDVQMHMVEFEDGGGKEPSLIMPIECRPLLDVLFGAYPQVLRVDTLLRKANAMEKEFENEFDMDDVREMIAKLYEEDLIQIEY